jgi:AraC-like DNA-binding protein
MKNDGSFSTVSFHDLENLFVRQSATARILAYPVGAGHVEVYTLAKGLQARFWNCEVNQQMELFGDECSTENPAYFTLAFFLSTSGFRFANKAACLAENITWDTVFISDRSVCKLIIAPRMKVECLSISFSKEWLRTNVLEIGSGFQKIKETVYDCGAFSLLGSMTAGEKKLVTALLKESGKGALGSFSIKCGVLKMISDFFLKLKERDTLAVNYSCLEASIIRIEAYLSSQLQGRLPKMKDLEKQFAISASTLKRHFKKKFGENISTYFIRKKLDYAKHLIEEQHTDVKEAAAMLGYRNVRHFIKLYQKYCSSILPEELCDLNSLLSK